MNELLLKGLQIHWEDIPQESWLRSIKALAGTDTLFFHAPVTLFAGENGSGKSTLLEAIAVAYGFNPEGGTRNYSFSTYDSHSDLHEHISLMRSSRRAQWGYYLRAESFYNVATKEDEYSRGPGGTPQHYHQQSHGESFLAMAQDNFKASGLYLLDEPEAALSPQRQMTMMLEIWNSVKEGSQFIIVSHSPILLAYPDADIISFDEGKLHRVDYEDTESYKITSMFINDKEHMMDRLLLQQT